MEKFIDELKKVNLLSSEIEKVWLLERLANDLKNLADLKRKNMN
tara:strand:- start:452 stop:583 length:132 start_codon:yes stop_codon:yes gene_type:complete